jgi:hypothetical protein
LGLLHSQYHLFCFLQTRKTNFWQLIVLSRLLPTLLYALHQFFFLNSPKFRAKTKKIRSEIFRCEILMAKMPRQIFVFLTSLCVLKYTENLKVHQVVKKLQPFESRRGVAACTKAIYLTLSLASEVQSSGSYLITLIPLSILVCYLGWGGIAQSA